MKIRVPNLNIVILAGRLTAQPEQKETSSGTTVTNFTVAVNQTYKDGEGEWKSKTVFADITAWARLAEYAASLGKGSPVVIQGSLQSNNYTDRDGNTRKSFQVVAQRINSLEKKTGKNQEEIPATEEEDDDLPF